MNRISQNFCFNIFFFFLLLISPNSSYCLEKTVKYTQTQHSQATLSPQQVLEQLKEGNQRFISGTMQHRNYNKQTIITSEEGQAPYAVILSCMDSRGPVEIVLDQGIGDIFSLRIAGNVVNQDIIGSMEYGTKVIGAKVIVVMGHTQCGAVGAACKSTELGNLGNLLNTIKPSVNMVVGSVKPDCSPINIDKIAKQNVINMIHNLRANSRIIDQLAKNKNVLIVGAMQDLSTGKVDFFDVAS